MATNARPNRKVAPKASTKAEVSATSTFAKTSFFARAKTVVIKMAKHVVSFIKTQARKVSLVSRVVTARIKPIVKRAWTVALRPYLGGVLAGVAFGTLLVGAFVAPVATVLTLVVAGGMFVLLARLVKQAEDTANISRFSRGLLLVLETVGQALRALAYAGAALIALTACAASLPFAVFTALALTLAYYDVRGGGTIAFLAWCVLSGSWGFGLLWLMWRGAGRLAFKQQEQAEVVDVPEYSEIRRRPRTEHADVLRVRHVAVGTEEVADLVEEISWVEKMETDACDACGTTQGGARLRSNALPFVTVDGPHFGQPHETSTALLCSSCYQAECEDNAIALTGMSLAKRSVNVALNALGRSLLPEVAASKADMTQLFWATTAWWRDRKNNHHERQWDCFHDGRVVATVTYDHARKVYRASVRGKFIATKTGLSAAKLLATDTIFDENNAVTRIVEVLDAAVAQGG